MTQEELFRLRQTGAEVQRILDAEGSMAEQTAAAVGAAESANEAAQQVNDALQEIIETGDIPAATVAKVAEHTVQIGNLESLIFDISANNPTEGHPTPYANLAAALGEGGANVPESMRKGGMSVKFIQGNEQGSDNKYVQFRYMGTETTGNPNPFLDTANWQGVDDEPTAGSKNLITSGGVDTALYKMPCSKIDDSDADLNLGDGNGNVILQLKGGHIRTKDFNSKYTTYTKSQSSASELAVGDKDGNVILQLKGGHIRTKNFDSKVIIGKLLEITNRTIDESTAVTIDISEPILSPILVNLIGSSTTGNSVMKFRYNGYKVINDVVIENTAIGIKEYILPPFLYDSGTIEITISSGVYIKNLQLKEYSARISPNGVFFTAHLGAYLGYNNIPSFAMAAKLGFKGCVANIQTTGDDVLVCSHDYSFIGSDNNTYNIGDLTYEQINALDWYDQNNKPLTKRWKDFFGGFVLPKVSDFLEICHNTGMHPIFSIDVNHLPNWSNLKTLLDKYGFNNFASFTLKFKGSTSTYFTDAYNVFGDSARYAVYLATQTQEFVDNFYSINLGESVKILEAANTITPSLVEYIISKNMKASIFDAASENLETSTVTTKTFRDFVKIGVSEFTTDAMFHNNVNW